VLQVVVSLDIAVILHQRFGFYPLCAAKSIRVVQYQQPLLILFRMQVQSLIYLIRPMKVESDCVNINRRIIMQLLYLYINYIYRNNS